MADKESFSINGESIVKKVKELINEGNVTKITITNHDGKEIMSFPINYGLVGINGTNICSSRCGSSIVNRMYHYC